MVDKEKEWKNKYTIDELSELTGFSRRTIRYYIHEGLLEPPAGRGRVGFYFDSHLGQLQLIKQLREKEMSLSSIAKYLILIFSLLYSNISGQILWSLQYP